MNKLHDWQLQEILQDIVAYVDENKPRAVLDKWSKEQLVYALRDMVHRARRAPKFVEARSATDVKWMQSLERVHDAREALQVLLVNKNYLTYDPYCKDLRDAMLRMVERVLTYD
jgi:hypothetical protein